MQQDQENFLPDEDDFGESNIASSADLSSNVQQQIEQIQERDWQQESEACCVQRTVSSEQENLAFKEIFDVLSQRDEDDANQHGLYFLENSVEAIEEEEEDSPFSPFLSCVEKSQLFPNIDIAYLSWLEKTYPLKKEQDQNVFTVVLLALFAKMHKGDICINISSLKSIYDVVSDWITSPEDQNEDEEQFIDDSNVEFFKDEVVRYLPASPATLIRLLNKAPAVGDAESTLPIVYDHKRLYVRRYFEYERKISDFMRNVYTISYDQDEQDKLFYALNKLFVTERSIDDLNWQKIAAVMSTCSSFTVISGGPGTGKTTTVLRILLLLICASKQNVSIRLCAPTGKAAARMSESISAQLKTEYIVQNIKDLSEIFNISSDAICSAIPEKAETVHRMLKVIPHTAKPIYNKDNHLPCDILVIDEVSMLDLALFAKIIDALDPSCHIIMLGDKDQLSSVEAGAVLGDLCACLDKKDKTRVSQGVLKFLSRMTSYTQRQLLAGKIADNTALLRFSYRSRDVPEIGRLAGIINTAEISEETDNEISRLLSKKDFYEYSQKRLELRQGQSGSSIIYSLKELFSECVAKRNHSISFNELSDFVEDDERTLKLFQQIRMGLAHSFVSKGKTDNYAPFLQRLSDLNFEIDRENIEQCDELFKLMDHFRILCSNHSGMLGDSLFNRDIARKVRQLYLHDYSDFSKDEFFPGEIIIITKNDPILGLVNGDVGFCAYDVSYPKLQGYVPHRRKSTKKANWQANSERLKVFIPSGVEEVNGVNRTKVSVISPLLLTHYELGYAMSIHKSQGSEYNQVSLVLAAKPNRVLTRELVYTGITRARKKVSLVSTISSLRYAVTHSVERESGLALRLEEVHKERVEQYKNIEKTER